MFDHIAVWIWPDSTQFFPPESIADRLAEAAFVDVLRELPNDWLADDYLQKCRAFAKEPPPPEWNAVHVMASK